MELLGNEKLFMVRGGQIKKVAKKSWPELSPVVVNSTLRLASGVGQLLMGRERPGVLPGFLPDGWKEGKVRRRRRKLHVKVENEVNSCPA